MSGTKTVLTKFTDIYTDLNEQKKNLLRIGFLEEHGYSLKSDTFYKKLRGDSHFYLNEQKWICSQLSLNVEDISFGQ